ncbi:methyl-accepting chemotaxis protein [Rhodoferax saidenbachensis]|uniref:Methyl-accepting chemotaxis protein n=1 Tax=Rhodoferax saidenbachensis TaxID=1484693 RepID=A0ABU1ZH55_9BURK|nr:methyl-accepting chemotaxis protein [Rhodoferax saidenbachensis]MDR7304862.1 methyl-accepting chemotaxis protein [Rhodoferax saidenbachensis]
MKLGTRLALAFGLLLVLLTAMAVMATRQIAVIHNALDYYTSTTTPSLEAVKSWQEKVAAIRMLQAQHLMTVSADEMGTLEGSIDQAYDQLNQALADHEKLLVNDEDRELWKAVTESTVLAMANWDKLKAIARQSLTEPDKIEEARRLFTGKTERLFKATMGAIDKEWEFKSRVAAQLTEQGNATYKLSLSLLAAACAVALAVGVAAAFVVVRSIARQMGGEPADVARIALSIAQGDLTQQVQTRPGDQSSVMAAMATMRERLAALVGEVRQSSDSIATGSAEIATGNSDLSHRTEEQASDLQQTVTAMEQLTHTVKHNADTAEQANRLATSASASAVAGGQTVAQVVATMQGIAASSKTISDITGVIDGIAFQTNILALNAAVEAARAGEQGRGFAVVASEVRSLAHRSAEAAKEIKKLIGDNVGKVEAGTRQVDEAGRSIQAIVTEVQHVGALIHDIHNATAQQYQGISQVSDAVGRIDQVTLQNAALVEESSAAAESLRLQAVRLAEIVGLFRLDRSNAAPSTPPTTRLLRS